MSTRYSDWVRAHESESGYGWVKYRLHRFGTSKFWRFWNLNKFRDFIADNSDHFMWAMTFSFADGSFYYFNGVWRPSSGARLAFFRDFANGKVDGKCLSNAPKSSTT